MHKTGREVPAASRSVLQIPLVRGRRGPELVIGAGLRLQERMVSLRERDIFER